MTKNTRAFLLLIALPALLLALTGCSGGNTSGYGGGTTGGSATSGGATGGSSGGANTITESNFQFSPAALAVKVGDVVTFVNQDTTAHHVVVGTTDLGDQQPGASVTWTADKDGTYAVKCTIHPSMAAQITVGAGGGSSGSSGSSTSGGSSTTAPPTTGYGY